MSTRTSVATQAKAKAAVAPLAGRVLQRQCACGQHSLSGECEDCQRKQMKLNRHSAGRSELGRVPPIVHEVLRSAGRPLDTNTRDFMEARFGHDFSRVRVHADARAAESARAVSAAAYTVGEHLVFGPGGYRPETERGRHLIAHELTHVLQQGQGPIPARLHFGSDAGPLEAQAQTLSHAISAAGELRGAPNENETATHDREPSGQGIAKGLLQRRRIPDAPGLDADLPTSAGFTEARAGLARAISRAWGEMTPAQQAAVKTAVAGLGITWATEAQLLAKLNTATRAQLINFAHAVRTVDPTTELGNPALIDTGARPATADAANIAILVAEANVVFVLIQAGINDTDIAQIFGAANVAAAKAKYANAQSQMHTLQAANKIVTDRSGFNAEDFVGGLSNAQQIALNPKVIDNPAEKESVITLIHESMHAGNNDVKDNGGYITQPSFTVQPESVKLTNAAHFEIVPRRILGANHAFAGQTFVPAGTTSGGPGLTPRQQAVRDAADTFRQAWTAGLRLHKLYVELFKAPTEWNTRDLGTFNGGQAGAHFADALPFWSKVEMLTIHTRLGSINPAGTPAVKPVTLIDIALSEGLVRKLVFGLFRSPKTPTDAVNLESASATAAERAAAAVSADAERDLLIKLVIKTQLGDLTGSLSRDAQVVARLAQAGKLKDFSDMLVARPPSAFP